MKEKIGQVKEWIGKLSSKTKKIIIAGAVVLLLAAVGIAFALNNKPYEVLFYGLGPEEAQQIVEKLQEEEIPFKFKNDSTILVEKDIVDSTKAKLVQEGYPKNGFAYNTYINNAGMMATDADKDTYKLYDLQDRIGATIRTFDGVKDAKVTIALGEESKYALSDEEKEKSSATAVVTMKDGVKLSEKQAAGIQRLVATSVPNLEMTDVAVFDGEGHEVSVGEDTTSDSSDAEEIAQIVENQIAQKVMKVLGPIYGEDNVTVSARAKINMEKLIRESTTYTTPEKIDENDKTGIVSKEETMKESSSTGAEAQGVAGAETNADTPEYNTNGTTGGSQSSSESVSKEYLVNQIKEQGQVDPGVLDDLTVSVAINGNGFGNLREAQLRSLIGNASGIAAADQATKITVASAPFYRGDAEDAEPVSKDDTAGVKLAYVIIGIGILLLIIILVIFFVLRAKRRKKEEALEEAELAEDSGVPPVLDLNEEIMEMQNDRGMELKKSIRDFADQNPEISAQLLKNWLNGGDGNDS